jgi:glycine/D-amino acid oxidase-like deaminating enzyme/nitrite reductase/ring-hydroxylating ferredoxin subunit
MNQLHPGESLSAWLDTHDIPTYTSLDQNINVDVCVIGGGIAGLTTAYMLIKEGKSVCILESFELGSGQTGRTTAHASAALGTRYYDLETYHSEEGARLIAQSHTAALDRIEQIVATEKIECNLERLSGYLFQGANTESDVLMSEHAAARRAGLIYTKMLENAPLTQFKTGPCLAFPRQLQFHPLKYITGLAKAITAGGGKIFTHTHAVEFHNQDFAAVKTRSDADTEAIVTCSSLVVATNTPVNDVFAIHTKQAPYRTYALGFTVVKDSVAKGLYWDTEDPYHYMRLETLDAKHDLLIVGGEDHKTGQEEHPEKCYNRLEEWARARFSSIVSLSYRWSGQIMEPVDGIGFLGHNPLDRDNVYVITGDAGNGITHSTIGAMIITDQIMLRANPWEELYNPSRISLLSTPNYLRENLNVAGQYSKWLSLSPKPDIDDLRLNEGRIFRDGMSMVAVYKNEAGVAHYMSAACPHLGAVVSWNNVEKSWDCPCHGSRFDCHGKVLEGPAVQNLKPLNSEDFIEPDFIPTKQPFQRPTDVPII